MIYLNKGEENNLNLNINNNSNEDFTGYTLTFTHIVSQEVKTYTVDVTDPNQYISNSRYCIITLDLSLNDLNYLGQYELKIYGDGTNLVYVGMVMLEGDTEPSTQFIELTSNNENNSNYIYIN